VCARAEPRVDLYGLSVVLHGSLEVALQAEHFTEIAVGSCLLRMELQDLPVLLDGLVDLALLAEGEGEVDAMRDVPGSISMILRYSRSRLIGPPKLA